jgi:hypothetical protein
MTGIIELDRRDNARIGLRNQIVNRELANSVPDGTIKLTALEPHHSHQLHLG